MEIIDLSNDFYLVKFSAYSNQEFALTGGLWLIYDHYLKVRPWDPNFDPEDMEIEKVVVWVRIIDLPITFFDNKFLTFVGNKIGRTIKVDAITLE